MFVVIVVVAGIGTDVHFPQQPSSSSSSSSSSSASSFKNFLPRTICCLYCFSCDFTIAVDAVRIIRIGIVVVGTCLRIRSYAATPRLPEVFRWQAKRSSRPQGDPFFSNREPRPLKEDRVARYFDAYVIVGSVYLFIVPRGSLNDLRLPKAPTCTRKPQSHFEHTCSRFRATKFFIPNSIAHKTSSPLKRC